MRIAIMQPYFFPYIGYFQLINSVDVFIVYDDVNYIKQGWINRNRILLNNKDFFITLSLIKASSFKKINEIQIKNNKIEILRNIKQAYLKSAYFKNTYTLIEKILRNNENNLSKFVINTIYEICDYLNINTRIMISSDLKKNNELKGEMKIINICQVLNANEYINAIGGQRLYDKQNFHNQGINLKFIKSRLRQYNQTTKYFIEGLSIIDVLMHNSKEEIQKMLEEYEII